MQEARNRVKEQIKSKTESMSWNNVDEKHKRRFDRDSVSCEEKNERDYIIRIIVEEFPQFKSERVENAVDHCCRIIHTPRPRRLFLNCLAAQLG